MATSDEIVTESKIREDINHTLRIYVLAELTSENEILGLEIINDLCQQFRHSHVELKKSLTNYSDVYQNDYAVIYEKLVTFTKDAKKQLKVVRQMACDLKQQAEMQKYVAQKETSRQARDNEQQNMCMAEVEFLSKNISIRVSCWNR